MRKTHMHACANTHHTVALPDDQRVLRAPVLIDRREMIVRMRLRRATKQARTTLWHSLRCVEWVAAPLLTDRYLPALCASPGVQLVRWMA